MAVEIRIAQTPGEMDDVFRLRHQIFVEEEGRLEPHADGRLYDRFDTFDGNVNLIAYLDTTPVGTLRLTPDSPMGVALDDHYDLAELRRRAGLDPRPSLVVSLLGLRRDVRAVPGVGSALLTTAADWIQLGGYGAFLAMVNPLIAELLERMGLERWGQPVDCPRVGQQLVPMIGFNGRAPVTCRPLPPGPRTRAVRFYQPGEVLFEAGAPAQDLLQVVGGRVRLVLPGAEGSLLDTLGAGEVFGTLGLSPDSTHRYTAVAETPCDVRVLEGEALAAQVEEDHTLLARLLLQQDRGLRQLGHLAADKERHEATGLSLFNGYLKARVVHALAELGLFRFVPADGRVRVAETAFALDVPEANLEALLAYLYSVGLLTRHQEGGRRIYQFRQEVLASLQRELGFVSWLLGGYDPVLDAMGDIVSGRCSYGTEVRRNDQAMASSSAMISRVFTDEHMYELLRLDGVHTVADIGCGSGLRLIEICQKIPGLRGIGLDISGECCALARRNVGQAGLSDRIQLVEGRAEGWIRREGERLRRAGPATPARPADLVLCFAMFHDLLNHDGAAEAFLTDLKEGLGPGAWILIQDQMRLDRREDPNNPSWAKGFELVHHLMGQRLFPREVYEALFERVGLTIARRAATGIPENWIYLLRT